MISKILRLSLLLLLIRTPVLFAEPEIIFNYYDVDGQSVKEIQKSMKKNSRQNGYDSYGHTKWRLQWSYRSRTMGGACVVEAVITHLVIEYRMPKWLDRGTDPELTGKWNRFYKALMIHEEGHGDMGRKAEEEVKKTFPKLAAGTSCPAFKQIANQELQRVLVKYQSLEKEYDKKTRHGRTQGAIFPPR